MNRLHQVLMELIPAGAPRNLTASRARALLATVRPRHVVGRARRQLAVDLIDDVSVFDRKIKTILDEDWTQAHNLAAEMPDKVAHLKETFAIEAARNSVYPVGGGLWVMVLHPELRISSPYREWNFSGDIVRVPEFCAPALGNRAHVITIDATTPESAHGVVLYSLGSGAGGLTCYVDDGYLCYEYNCFILMRTKIRSDQRLPTGPVSIEIRTENIDARPGGPLAITMRVNDQPFGAGQVPVSVPILFTANDCLDIGRSLGSPVALDYYDRAPFPFNGTIANVNVRYLT